MYDKTKHFIIEGERISASGRTIKIGKFFCVGNGKTYETLFGLRNAIRKLEKDSETYYRKYYFVEGEDICVVCTTNNTPFSDVLTGYKQHCSIGCFNRTEEKREKIRNRFVGKPEKVKLYAERYRKTWNSLPEEVRQDKMDRQRATLFKNSTFEERSNHSKKSFKVYHDRLKTDLEFRKTVFDKKIATMIKNNSFHNGMTGRVKSLVINGVEYKYQGYEDALIRYLVEKDYSFLSRSDVPPVIMEDRPSGKYIADFYLPEFNLLVDVKSERTVKMKQDDLYLKISNAHKQGFNMVYFALHSKSFEPGNVDRIICTQDKKCFEDFLNMLISSQALGITPQRRFNDYPVVGSTLQAIGSGSAEDPTDIEDRDIV